jgi:hypothetical protein
MIVVPSNDIVKRLDFGCAQIGEILVDALCECSERHQIIWYARPVSVRIEPHDVVLRCQLVHRGTYYRIDHRV